MTSMSQGADQSPTVTPPRSEPTGLYVYCVTPSAEPACWAAAGIDGRSVRMVAHRSLGALVHDCPPRPYQADDAETVAAWVLAHHQVVDAAWKQWGTVLPLNFNTIIPPTDEGSASENLKAWLDREAVALGAHLEALVGKAEYGVQVFWDPALIAQEIARSHPEIRQLQQGLAQEPRGRSYMYGQRLKRLLGQQMEAYAEGEFRALYGRLVPCVDQIHVERTKPSPEGRPMLMNLSCLVSALRYSELEAELSQIENQAGLAVRLTGPLPAYSFC